MNRRSGFTFPELLVALALGGLLVLVAVPALSGVLQRARLDGAARQAAGDMSRARSRAVTTGWEYRVVGYDAGAARSANSYRTLARRNPSVAWLPDDAPPTLTANQYAGPWIDLAEMYPGTEMASPGGRFEVTFDSRGTAAGASRPLRLVDGRGNELAIVVSVAGSVTVR